MGEAVQIGESAERLPVQRSSGAEVVKVPSPAKSPARASRPLMLLGGRLAFDAAIFPILGPATAKYVVADVMDYTCENCRELHPMLDAVIKAFAGELAVVAVPAPLERLCNAVVQVVDPRHTNACEYAKLAMAVDAVDPGQFPGFHSWLFDGPGPPSLDAARAKAITLVGEGALNEALGSQRVRQQLADGVAIYRLTGGGPLPKLLLPTGMLMGKVSSAEKLLALFREQLANVAAPVAAAKGPVRAGPFSNRAIG
jgi:protein-disulfide isomerase